MNAICSKVLIVIAALAASAPTRASEGGERERAFFKALETFEKARTPNEFRYDAEAFEALLSPEFQNDVLYFNIGNARVKAGDYGRAILAYRKAKPFRPRDPWLDANLNQALGAVPRHIGPAPDPWWRSIFFWSNWLSYSEKFHLALALFAVSVLALSIAALKRMKRLSWAGGALAAAAIIFSIDAYAAYRDVYFSNRAAVVAETVARRSPGLNGDPAFDQPLKDGDEFTIIDRRGDWVFGHFHGIGDAWLPAKNIAE